MCETTGGADADVEQSRQTLRAKTVGAATGRDVVLQEAEGARGEQRRRGGRCDGTGLARLHAAHTQHGAGAKRARIECK